MFEKLEIFRMAHAMATHAGTRQAIVAQNIANADSPGYKPRDVVPFAELVKNGADGGGPRATRASHLHGALEVGPLRISEVARDSANPNDNGVSLEEEMLNAVEVKRQHDRALAIYRSGLTILRSSLGGR